ncbi:MAG: helix-turn-helix transcriptional regulator [Pelotomaculum sp.]|uniref:Uncharacterized protein conserved in bacteria n=1 Tax=Pelotomaculum thermopropionicum (strain DSM 13744 / JCM 10971 / SI) TaxID=370438 RepID=A5D441_PELTS|nr:helix-turn-helix transcriptional regulator [Pelotomaculum sp.]BAF58979.1 Uncharacterized protein conserved in bacteria [Pelotomaculum thermopropionicum SI]
MINTDDILKVFGKNVRQYRKMKGLTLKQMSRGLNITGAYLGYLERGQRNPSLLALAEIAKTLEVQPYLLLIPSRDEFEEELIVLVNMLNEMGEIKHVIFLKEVLKVYLNLHCKR